MVNAINPLNPIQPNISQNTALPTDVFPGLRQDNSGEAPRLVVDRRQDVTSAREEVPREEVEKATDKLNRLMSLIDKRRVFQIHEQSHQLIIKIIDEKTNEVVDEIPPKRLLDILSSITQIVGILVDKRV
ncbi:flagellar protein FlaG [Desulfitobacterium sp. AusDCA]|uniref:flagellar protein FlaG n=1 Tax=Desulfitobacterium sp. AusDCA TaxID=3240383 RepID=UPI003DA751DB